MIIPHINIAIKSSGKLSLIVSLAENFPTIKVINGTTKRVNIFIDFFTSINGLLVFFFSFASSISRVIVSLSEIDIEYFSNNFKRTYIL